MEQPLISIVTPTYNRCERLASAITSVLNQSYQSWELVVVDDGSTDATKAVVEGFEDQRIRYVYQENQELAAARNTGIRESQGGYVGFLDDDDRFLPDHLEAMVRLMQEDVFNHKIYRSGQILVYPDGKRINSHNYENNRDQLPQLWEKPCGPFGFLFEATVIKARFFREDQLLLEDFFWLNNLILTYPFLQLDAFTVVVQIHEAQRSGTYLDHELLETNISTLAEAYNVPGVSERVPFDAYRRQVLHQYLHFTRQLIRGGKHFQASKTYWKGLSYATAAEWKDVAKTAARLFGA